MTDMREAFNIINKKLQSAKKSPVILSWDDAETIKAALSQPSEGVEELAGVIYTHGVRQEQWHTKAAQAILARYHVTERK